MAERSTGAAAFDLVRFVMAQEGLYERACSEIAAGCKRSHWMWFVFPQMRGLGHSATAMRFGIVSLAEARAYLEHPVLGPRLKHAAELLLGVEGRTANEIMGFPDDLKLRSSMTLFLRAAAADAGSVRSGLDGGPFLAVLERYFGGQEDAATLQLIDA